MKKICVFILITGLLLPTLEVMAQDSSQPNTRISVYYILNGWKTEYTGPPQQDTSGVEGKLNQDVFGLSVGFAPSDRFSLDVNGAYSSTSLTPAGEGAFKLSSLNDTRLRGTYYVADRKGSISVYTNLPTGKRELTDSQYVVSAQISDISRKFVVRRVGQGLDIGTDWYALPQFGSVILQIGGGYLYKGKYQVLKGDSLKYKYGDEISGRIGFATDTSPFSASGNVTLRYYTKDKLGDQDNFQAGVATSFGGMVSYSDAFDVYVGVNLLNRGKSKAVDSLNTLSEEAYKSGRNELLFYTGGSYPITPELRLLANLEYLSISANDYPATELKFRPKSHYLGIGVGPSYSLTDALSAGGMATFYTGKIDDDYDLSGFGLALILTFRPM